MYCYVIIQYLLYFTLFIIKNVYIIIVTNGFSYTYIYKTVFSNSYTKYNSLSNNITKENLLT